MKRLLIFFCIIMWVLSSGFSQEKTIPGEAIVMLHPGVSIDHILRYAAVDPRFRNELTYKKCLSPRLNIHLLELSKDILAFSQQMETLKGYREIRLAQPNHQVDARRTEATPNDVLFGGQWALDNTGQSGGVVDADVDAPEAWDLATGGLSALGDTLVIAIVDEGIDLTHEDLYIWKNLLEVASNGKDDDQNGYVDDAFGWNSKSSTGDIIPARHGTHVAGIAAARGNNGKGIAGINWETQVMAIVGESPNEAIVVEAYGYVFEQRSRYEETNGKEGAFIVATNSSFGVNSANPANFPIWCSMYDTLGSLGILNAVSTANQGVNVDLAGDMPSTCPSDFVISVTATNRADALHPGSAYGRIHIDLGAPGAQVQSTIPGNSYAAMTGTSMASPHVSGAVSLMVSGAGPRFMSLYKNYPDSAALILKDRLLKGVDQLPGFDTLTSSGGRLNLFGGLTRIQGFNDSMSDCTLPYYLAAKQVTDSSATLAWEVTFNPNAFWIQYRPVGGSSWMNTSVSVQSFDLQGLTSCSLYEFRVASICGADTGDFSAIHIFESEGCCRPPTNIQAISLSETDAVLSWEQVYAADSFRVMVREMGTTPWMTFSLTDTFLSLTNLNICTAYETRIYTRCDTGLSGTFRTFDFTTEGCGYCRSGIFCTSKANDATEDWIAGVELAQIANTSGTNGGYGDFTEFSTDLWPGISYSLKFTPGFAATAFGEHWKAWIDYDHDGEFDESTEKIYDSGSVSDTVVTGQFMVPFTALSGPTRLRVSMRFSVAPDACSNFPFGEVEDYCVDLRGLVGKEKLSQESQVIISPNPVKDLLTISSEKKMESIEIIGVNGQRLVFNPNGQTEIQIPTQTLSSGLYLMRIQRAEEWVTKKIVVE